MSAPVLDREALRRVESWGPVLEALPDGKGIHVVGGAVRDVILGRTPVDLDLVVEGDAMAVALELGERLGATIRAHDRFGTAEVDAGGVKVNLARSRRERYEYPGALPDVEPAPLAEDLLRRDFTINAMAVAVAGGELGELVTAPGAQDDLEARQLRVLHDGSFEDDPTRLLRMARYETRLGFEIEPSTAALAAEAVAAVSLATVSPTRTGAELRLALREPDALGTLERFQSLGLLGGLHPRLLVDREAAGAADLVLPAGGRRDLLLLAVTARRIPRPTLSAWLDALEFEGEERDLVVMAAEAERLVEPMKRARTASELVSHLARHPAEAVALAGALGAEEQAREYLSRLRHVTLEIDGRDLIAGGVEQGPDIGRGLDAALDAKLDGIVSSREEELRVALAAAGDG